MPDDVPSTLGEYLQAYRARHDLSIRQLAAKANMALSHLLYIERDMTGPGPESLQRLADAMEVDVEVLQDLSR